MCGIISKTAVSRRWQFDSMLDVMQLARQNTRDESIQSLIHVLEATPELKPYAIYRIFLACAEH